MARANPNRVAYGNVVLQRLSSTGVPPALKADHKTFKARHATFATANDAVTAAEKVYEKVADSLGTLDARRDKSVLELADKLPGAGLGTRTSPFASFSQHAPTKLIGLPYAAQTNEVRSLLSAIDDAKPSAEVAKLCARCAQENEAVAAALESLTTPVAALNEARTKRDIAIPDWEKALRHLKESAKIAFRDTPGRFDTVFAEPEAVQTNLRSRPRKKPVTPPPTDATSQSGAAAPAPAAKKKAKRRVRRG